MKSRTAANRNSTLRLAASGPHNVGKRSRQATFVKLEKDWFGVCPGRFEQLGLAVVVYIW